MNNNTNILYSAKNNSNYYIGYKLISIKHANKSMLTTDLTLFDNNLKALVHVREIQS